MNPIVSVIIPTYNRAHFVGETLDSVLAQTYQNWECIVVDDGSTDYTDELLEFYTKRDSRIQHDHRPTDRKKGANACRNYGLKTSKGEFLIFLDSDDLLARECLRNRLNKILEFPDFNFYVFPMKKFKRKMGDNTCILNHYANKKHEYLEMFFSHNIPWPITSLFIKVNSLNITFNEDLDRFQDLLFSLSLVIENSNFKNFQWLEADCYYRNDFINKNKYNNSSFIAIILNSFLTFLLICEKEVLVKIEDHDYRQRCKALLGKAYYKYLYLYVFKDLSTLKDLNSRIILHLQRNHYLNLYDRLKLNLLNKIIMNQKSIKKGIGVFRLARFIAKP